MGSNTQYIISNVVHIIVTLFRLLGLSVALEPMNLFSDFEPDDNRRPDILIRNPYGGGKQIIIDVAVTGIDGTTRTNGDKPDQPLNARSKQKNISIKQWLNKMGFTYFQLFSLMLTRCTRIPNIFSLNKLD